MQKSVWVIGAVAIVVAVAGIVHYRDAAAPAAGPAAAAAGGPPPGMPVPVATVVKRSVPIFLAYSARTESIRNVTLQARITGYVMAQKVEDGADVAAGDLLYQIDPRDYQAALAQAKAQAQRDTAALDYARSNRDRGSELVKNGFLAKDTFEQRASSEKQAQAALASDDAAIKIADLNLSYTEIRAPFAGRVGRNLAPVGTLIAAAGASLNTLVQLDPLYVTFAPSETDLAAIQLARSAGKVLVDVMVPGEHEPRTTGEITFIDNAVDQKTGTLVARATIPNANHALLPGQYVQARVHLREQPDALMVPQVAIGSGQLGKFVYIVGQDSKAEQKIVTPGPTDGDLVSVAGLSEGQQVITGNLQKIGPGSPVKPLIPKQAAAN